MMGGSGGKTEERVGWGFGEGMKFVIQTSTRLTTNYRPHQVHRGGNMKKIGGEIECAKGGEEENCLCCGNFIEELIAKEFE